MKLLPALDPTLQPPAPNAGADWGEHAAGLSVLAKYSGALAVSHAAVPAERLKSVPSPWARLLLFEQALFHPRHPAHLQVRSEWRGLLGAIGLARHLNLEVRPVAVKLAKESGVPGLLRAMAPQGDDTAVWDRIALLYLDGHLIGGTSPRTLVFTGIRNLDTGRVPFQSASRLSDPTLHYRDRGDRTSLALLLEWLEATRRSFSHGGADLRGLLGNLPAGEGAEPLSRLEPLLRAIHEWHEDTRAAIQAFGALGRSVSKSTDLSGIHVVFSADHPASAAFRHLLQVVPADDIGAENELQVAASDSVVVPGAAGFLTKDGHRYSGTIILPRGMSREVSDGRFSLPTGTRELHSTWPDLGSLFERRLIPVRQVSAESAQALPVNGMHYLYPFSPEILSHVTPSDLAAWTHVRGEHATGITVRIEVPLQGGLHLAHERTYAGGDLLQPEQVAAPMVAIWPDFESSRWSHYYYLERQAATQGGLRITPWSAHEQPSHHEPAAGLRWGKLAEPPRAWIGEFGRARGILISRPALSAPEADATWDVSIDFGSTHTRVFRAAMGVDGSRETREVRLSPRAKTLLEPDTSLPYHFFVDRETMRGSDAESPSLIWLPLDRVPEEAARRAWLPPDGVMFWGALEEAPETSGLRGNLKWHKDVPHEKAAFHSYASQLFLAVAAEAAAEGATIGSLITAYPSVLPRELRHRHWMEWRELARYGVDVRRPRSESDALAAYFVRHGQAAIATNLLAVDVGGSTSDLTVWFRGERAHGDSVRLAGDILSRLVCIDLAARNAISAAVQRPPFKLPAIAWDEREPSKNGLMLNSLLRSLSHSAVLKEEPDLLARNLYDGSSSPGERVIAHVGYLFAAVSFLLGLMVQRQGIRSDRYDVRFAGKGSIFLHWLEAIATGASRSLPQAFFRAANPLAAAEIDIVLPGRDAKQEVGRGLLLEPIGPDADPDDRATFVGESGFISTEGALDWPAPLNFSTLQRVVPPVDPVPIGRLTSLNAFVAAFQTDPAGKKIACALGISADRLDLALRNKIHDRLFGVQSAWHAARNGSEAIGAALLEPFFITEAKVLLEHATGNSALFQG